MNNPFPKRAIYFSIGFVFPSLLIICSTIVAVASPALPQLDGVLTGAGVLGALCVVSSQISLYNDTNS